MLQPLDVKYGDTSKIIESIVADIQGNKKLENEESVKLILFIDMLERAHRDLVALGLEGEIANANTVSIIENKLPKPLQMECYRQIYKDDPIIDKNAKFPFLLKFLCAERNPIYEKAKKDMQ